MQYFLLLYTSEWLELIVGSSCKKILGLDTINQTLENIDYNQRSDKILHKNKSSL